MKTLQSWTKCPWCDTQHNKSLVRAEKAVVKAAMKRRKCSLEHPENPFCSFDDDLDMATDQLAAARAKAKKWK